MDELENAIAIQGLGSIASLDDENFLGYVRRNTSAVKKQIANSTKAASGTIIAGSNSRSAFAGKINMLSADLVKGLQNKSLQLVDTAFMIVKSISNKSEIKMMVDADVKKAGVCMINGGKLEKGEAFLLNEIIVVSGIGDSIEENATTISQVKFGLIEQMLANGEFEFKANGKTLIPKMSMEVFNNAFIDDANGLGFYTGKGRVIGSYILDNPKLIETQTAMEWNAEWGVPAAEFAFLKVILVGSRIYKH